MKMEKDHVTGYVYLLGSNLVTFVLHAAEICVYLEMRELE